MSDILSPSNAAKAASIVYGIKYSDTSNIAINRLNDEFGDDFHFDISTRFKGKTGLPFISTKSGFGIMGISPDQHNKSAVISTRGTTSNPLDWLTDVNCGLSFRNSRSNKSVHSGFNHTFNSMIPEIDGFIKLHKPTTIHCVGHSLGGALATLIAEWLAQESSINTVNLYTFGSPRVGLEPFAQNLCSMEKVNKIFRATNAGDPVPLVPVWPFSHTPTDGSDYRVLAGFSINPFKHKMEHYINGVGGINDWNQIKRVSNHIPSSHIDTFLNSDQGQGSFRSTLTLEKIGAAIIHLLGKAGLHGSVAIQSALGVGFTMYDAIAWKLSDLAKKSDKMNNQVKNLMSHIAAFTGLPIKNTIASTTETIRMLFNRMIALLYYMARNSIGRSF